jgi:hypothetical protein
VDAIPSEACSKKSKDDSGNNLYKSTRWSNYLPGMSLCLTPAYREGLPGFGMCEYQVRTKYVPWLCRRRRFCGRVVLKENP